ncbi:MAG: metal ABC transporter substrate-binding protein [Lentisphaeria bacterium]|nr:metal ABC transporter substrate-binding protein [Lentisphaeria bacterium]
MFKKLNFQFFSLFIILFMVVSCGKDEVVEVSSKKEILVTTFPIYQITRNVVQGVDDVEVNLMLPSQMGCPHDYALTPQDMQNLANSDVLVVNGLGLEEFLGSPIDKANSEIIVLDSSENVQGILEFEEANLLETACEEESHDNAFEWAGAFKLVEGEYSWSFAKKDGDYADPAMQMLVLEATTDGAIQETKDKANKLYAGSFTDKEAKSVISIGSLDKLKFDQNSDVTTFKIKIEKPGVYVFFCEHFPYEFEASEHFFKNAKNEDVEPIAEAPEGDHHHHHHHDHNGENPHLFASPSMSAKVALNIAKQLSKISPESEAIFTENAKAYALKMDALATEMKNVSKVFKNNRIVASHGVFDYFARDADLEVVTVMQAHGQEPSAAQLLEMVKVIRDSNVGGIFTEPQYSDKVGKTLSKETGVNVAMLDPVATGPENAPLDYYEKVMRNNMEVLKETLGE